MPGFRAAVALAALLTFSVLVVRAHEESLEAVEAFLYLLADDGAITEAQHQVIDQLVAVAKQFRVYFELDDNDDTRPDYVGYYAGDNATAANRPQLVIKYQ